jgi:uncharacterized protein (DUF1684 family)
MTLKCALATAVLAASSMVSCRAQPAGAAAAATWRHAYSDTLDQPYGWLSLVALEWLEPGQTTVGSAADNKLKLDHVPAHLGTFSLVKGVNSTGERVEFTPAPGLVGLKLENLAAGGGVVGADDSEHPTAIRDDDVLITIIHRGDRFYLRVKDAMGKARLHFHGLRWYAYDPAWRLTAKWVPTQGSSLRIVNVLGQASTEPVDGYAEFMVDGKPYKLTPTVENGQLFFVMRDLTARTTTDGAGRFLLVPPPSNGFSSPGTVVLDFNYAHNPPCGYTPYATCPLPPPENRLALAIHAGEKRYDE